MDRGARKKPTRSKKPLPRTHKSRKSKMSHKSRTSRKSKHTNDRAHARVPNYVHKHAPNVHKQVLIPKTAKVMTHKSNPRVKKSYADSTMSLTDLQFMARSAGIPFGGLSRDGLIRKINAYR